jgi:hypothetical protein
MAITGVLGPFESPGGPLAAGQVRWVDLGEHEELSRGAGISVTASGQGPSDGTYVLKVDDVNVSCVKSAQSRRWHVGCNVTNTGSTTVTDWRVLAGVIAAPVVPPGGGPLVPPPGL